jgi:hypothetical protein
LLNNLDLFLLSVIIFIFKSIELPDESIDLLAVSSNLGETLGLDLLLLELDLLVLLLEVSELLLESSKVPLARPELSDIILEF